MEIGPTLHDLRTERNIIYQQLTRTRVREAKITYATEEKCRNVTSSTKQ